MSTVHVVTGAGPVGSTIALQLADAGEPVRLLTRSGSGPEHPLDRARRVDVSHPTRSPQASTARSPIHHCIHGSAYDAKVWRAELPQAEQTVLEAAGRSARWSSSPRASTPTAPSTARSPRTRRARRPGQAGRAHRAARPARGLHDRDRQRGGVRLLRPARRNVPRRRAAGPDRAGRPTMRVIGSADQPHSFTYVPDLAAAMIVAAGRDRPLELPPARTDRPGLTQRELVELVAAAGGAGPRMSALPGVLSASGLVSREMRELAETSYQFSRPFVMDSAASEERAGARADAADRRKAADRRVVARAGAGARPDRRTDE